MMEVFYYICDFMNTAVQIWFILQLTHGMFEAKVTGIGLYAGQAVLIPAGNEPSGCEADIWRMPRGSHTPQLAAGLLTGTVALMKCSNDVMYQVLFSNGMLIVIAILLAVVGKILYEYRFTDGLCVNLLGLILLALTDFFVQTCVCVILDECGKEQGILMSVGFWRAFYLLAASFLLLPVGIKVRNWLTRWRKEAFRYRKKGFFLVFPLLVCMIYFQNIYLLYDSGLLLNHWKIFILGCILLSVLFRIYTVKRGTDEEVRIQQVKIEMLEDNYLSMQQVYNEKAVLVHDMKNHLYTLRNVLERGEVTEALEYVTEMTGEVEKSGNMVWSRHEMLDLILNRKIQEAKKVGIVLHCNCDDMRGLKLTTMELCALFANLLDNAIEAAERCPEGTERRIDVECRKRESMLLVMIQNRIAENETAKGIHILETTSKNKKEHGYGMKSIRKVIESYGGDVKVNIKEDIFQIRVSLEGFGK